MLFTNAEIMLRTCNLDFIPWDMPMWKYVYHMLHSCDQWYIHPFIYTESDFHEPNRNSLDILSRKSLSREQLLRHLESIKAKIGGYLDGLTDEDLYVVPEGCVSNRLGLVLSRSCHFYTHLDNINATKIIEMNQWPRVIGTSGKSGRSTDRLFR